MGRILLLTGKFFTSVIFAILLLQLLFPAPARRAVLALDFPYYTFLISKENRSLFVFEKEDAKLSGIIEAAIASISGDVSVVAENLTTGQKAAVHEHVVMPGASLYKVPVMIAWMDSGSTGSRNLDEETVARIERMITISSNEDGQWLGATIGWDAVSSFMQHRGYTDTSLGVPPVTSAHDMARIMTAIANNEFAQSSRMFEILAGQKTRDRIPKLLPEGTRVAHKTGEIDSLRHDVGIVEAPHSTYVLAIMGGNLKDPEADKHRYALLSRAIYEYFETQFTTKPSQVL